MDSLESRMERLGARSAATPNSFTVGENGVVVLSTGETARLGEDIYELNEPGSVEDVGKLVDVRPATQQIFIKGTVGRTLTFSPSSFRAQGFTTIPF